MGWSKEETDYLLDMLEAHDLRFVVVADRYNVRSSSAGARAHVSLSLNTHTSLPPSLSHLVWRNAHHTSSHTSSSHHVIVSWWPAPHPGGPQRPLLQVRE
jgi:hypothetical protein